MPTNESKYTSSFVEYTREESSVRSFNPPEDFVIGKVLNLNSYWGRMDGEAGDFYVRLWQRLSDTEFVEDEIGWVVLSAIELGNIGPINGDALWIWIWEELQESTILVERCHIEVERRKLSNDDRVRLSALLINWNL